MLLTALATALAPSHAAAAYYPPVWWTASPVSGTFNIEVPYNTQTVEPEGCSIIGGGGSAYLDSTKAYFTIQQTSSSGARAYCTVNVTWTEQEDSNCSVWCSYVTKSGTRSGSSDTYYVDATSPESVSAVRTSGGSPNAGGWFSSPFTVTWFGFDGESGIAYCSKYGAVGFDTTGWTLTGACQNHAGLSTSSDYRFKYDGTAPSLAPVVTPDIVEFGEHAAADPGATDRTSLVAASNCNDGQPLDTRTVGEHTITCTATDHAGNKASADVPYTVLPYRFGGFAMPVDQNSVNGARAGQTVPLRFSLAGAISGAPIADLAAVTVRTSSLTCDVGDTANLLDEAAAGASGLQNLGDGNYQFNWATAKSYASSCKTLHLDLGDGVSHDLAFRFAK